MGTMSRPRKETVKFIALKEARADFSELTKEAQDTTIVITKHGKPFAILTGVDGQTIEEVMREHEGKK